MSATMHTAGPWEWNEEDQLVSMTEVEPPSYPGGPKEPVVIIETDNGHYPPKGKDRPLLATAPTLLDFAKTVRDLCIIPPLMTEQARQLMRLQDLAVAVITKAEGGPQ